VINSRKYTNIIVTGSIAYDEIMDFPGKFINYFHPDKLHQINVSFVVNKLIKQIGGTATNIAYNAQLKLSFSGLENKVRIFGAVGKDGDIFLDFFAKNKIETQGLIIDKKLYTASGKVITDIKDNQIWGFYYGASIRGKKIKLNKFTDKNSLLILSANQKDAFLSFQKQAIKNNLDYLYDPGMCLTWIKKSELKTGILNSKYLIGNDYEISQILKASGLTKKNILNKDVSLITTLGEQGVTYEDRRNKLIIKAFPVKKVADPTGAGDAWRGGFAAGLVEGLSLPDCLKTANVMASFAVEKYGTVNHSPTEKEMKKRRNVLKVSKV